LQHLKNPAKIWLCSKSFVADSFAKKNHQELKKITIQKLTVHCAKSFATKSFPTIITMDFNKNLQRFN
jgi:hypothetical protein